MCNQIYAKPCLLLLYTEYIFRCLSDCHIDCFYLLVENTCIVFVYKVNNIVQQGISFTLFSFKMNEIENALFVSFVLKNIDSNT